MPLHFDILSYYISATLKLNLIFQIPIQQRFTSITKSVQEGSRKKLLKTDFDSLG